MPWPSSLQRSPLDDSGQSQGLPTLRDETAAPCHSPPGKGRLFCMARAETAVTGNKSILASVLAPGLGLSRPDAYENARRTEI